MALLLLMGVISVTASEHASSLCPHADAIIDAALHDSRAYEKLTELCDDIGHRLSGSPQYDQAVLWALRKFHEDGLDNIRPECVMVPRWVRGEESCEMLTPRYQKLAMLGLGGSVATPPEGITAEVVPVRDEAELRRLGPSVRGKFVLFTFAMPQYDPQHGTGYGLAVRFRVVGAKWAAGYGAAASLIRSVTARSLRSPHTGMMDYTDTPRKIPAAALSAEDVEQIQRLHARGIPITLRLVMNARDEGLTPAANAIAELPGRERPEEIVVIGGHLDSWDVGQGALDDGGGCVVAMEALRILRRLDLRPRRTIRVVLFANEENGLAGGRTYAAEHADELPRHFAAIECDGGVAAPRGFTFEINVEERVKRLNQQLQPYAALFARLGELTLRPGGSGADISPMKPAGVPLFGHNADMSTYFDYHHSQADTLDKINREDLNKNVAAMALMAYILADWPSEKLGE